MANPIAAGRFARIWNTSEPLTIIAVDGRHAWLKDDEGYKVTALVEELEPVSFADGRKHLAACDAIKRAEAGRSAAELVGA